jgi:serine/threonine protein kinase
MSSLKAVASGRFELAERLGAGCFGEVWRAFDHKAGHQVAVKLELSQSTDTLKQEAVVLRDLALSQNRQRHGFAQCFYFGSEGGGQVCLVMDLFGKSLEDKRRESGGSFTGSTVALLAVQMLDRIEWLHSRGYIHRDIKADNWMIGGGCRADQIYLIDFGLATRYHSKRAHLPVKVNQPVTGTVRYSSLNSHRGLTLSRRDDLESIGYLLAHLLRGDLPWIGLKTKSDSEKFRKIGQLKRDVPLSNLFHDHPDAFERFVGTARRLRYEERPDYASMKQIFQDVVQQCEEAPTFEWVDAASTNASFASTSACTSSSEENEYDEEGYLDIRQPDDPKPRGRKRQWLSGLLTRSMMFGSRQGQIEIMQIASSQRNRTASH